MSFSATCKAHVPFDGDCGTAEAVPFQNTARVLEAHAAEVAPSQNPVYANGSSA
jgi:hypothetical protein